MKDQKAKCDKPEKTSEVDTSYHKKQLNAMNDSMYKYPYLNHSLVDMDGEIWKDIPDYEGYYQISNKGRIKSLPREGDRIMNGVYIVYERQSRIKKQRCKKILNKHLQEYRYSLEIKLNVGNAYATLSVARLVYRVFVKEFDMEHRDLLVLHKNGNTFDNVPENLFLATRKEQMRILIERGSKVPIVTQSVLKTLRKNARKKRKTISQYDTAGNRLATFTSIAQASKVTGISVSSIGSVVARRNRYYTAGGFIWKENCFEEKLKEIRISNAHNVPKRIIKCSLDGEEIEIYPSILQAAQKNNLNYSSMLKYLRSDKLAFGGFIWKFI